jgi:AbiV family abortive infection protein
MFASIGSSDANAPQFTEATMPLTEEDKALARTLIGGAKKTFDNAEALFTEATILANSNAWSRALFLHQISLEECAKIEMLAAATTSLLMGHRVDLKPLRRAFSQHESKNKVNAYFVPKTEDEELAEEAGDFAGALHAFKELQEAFHRDSNADKNASLYVDFSESFTSPLELVTEETFVKVRKRNEEFMALTYPKVDMLARWAHDLEGAASKVAGLMGALDFARVERGNPEHFKAFRATLEDKIRELARKRLEQSRTGD